MKASPMPSMALKNGRSSRGVPGVAVDVEGGVGEGAGDDLQHFQIPARGRFQLDARESGVDGLLDVPEEHVVGVLDAEVSAGRHVAGPAAEKPVQGGPGDAALQRPPADLHGRLGEAVALENRQPLVELGGRVVLAPHDPGPHHLGDVVERGPGALAEIGGREEGGALRPGFVLAAGQLDEHRVNVGVFPIRRAPGIDERHHHVVHVESVDSHLSLRLSGQRRHRFDQRVQLRVAGVKGHRDPHAGRIGQVRAPLDDLPALPEGSGDLAALHPCDGECDDAAPGLGAA